MGFIKKTYRKTFGHKSPYRRVYGSRNAGQAIGSTYRTARGVAKDVASLMKDMSALKKRQNNEKKLIDKDVVTGNIGNVNQNAEGSMKLDVTPIIAQGITESTRVGNSLKLTGMVFPMSFTQMLNCQADRMVRISLYKVTSADDGVTPGECYNQLYDINPLTGLRDFNSSKAYRNAKTDGIKLIRSTTIKVPVSQAGNSDSAQGSSELQVRNVRFSVKLQDLLRYNSNAQTTPSGTRYFLIIQCNAGNSSATASTKDVAVTTGNSGIVARIAQRIWYVDN